MTLDIRVDPQTASLLTAIGVTDADGQLVGAWFDNPLIAVRQVLSNPTQRAALLRLLDDLLTPDPSLPGWYPLLDTEVGNLYLTVENDVVGVAAALHSGVLGSGVGQVQGTVRVPLISVAGDFEAIAGTAEGPLLIGVDVGFTDVAIPMSRIGAAVTVHLDDTAALGVQAGVRVTVYDFNLGGGDPVDLVIESARVGADLISALKLLLEEVVDLLVAEAGGNEQLARLGDHLFELLGMSRDPASDIPALPIEDLFQRPGAVLDWLVDIVDTPDTLTAWATHLAGLIGDDLEMTGTGEEGSPFRARLLDSDVVDLFLLLEVSADRQLEIGLEVRVDAGPVALSAVATVLRIPLPAVPGVPADPSAPPRFTRLAPEVTVGLVAPTAGNLVDDAPALQIGRVGAGFRLVDGDVEPWLEVSGVVIDGDDYGAVSLADADAVIGVASGAALSVLEDALGDVPVAGALLTLLGLRRPIPDNTWPLLDPAALGRGPTVALGGLHRELLASTAHPWSHMLEQVAVLVGLAPAVSGSGRTDEPWVTPIATAGSVTLSLAAWNARVDTDPAGLQRLRLGIMAGATQGVFQGTLLLELLAIDLPETGSGLVSLIGRSQLAIQLTPDGPLDLSGLQLTAGRATAMVGWRPGEAPVWRVGITDVTMTVDGGTFGPYAFELPGLEPDLGLGDDAIRLLGQLLSSALRSWAGKPAYVLTALLGMHRDQRELADDWPLLSDLFTGAGQLQQLLDDPRTVLRAHLQRLLTGISADDTAYVTAVLQLLGRLLPDDVSLSGLGGAVGDLDSSTLRSITGNGSYDDPWVIPIVESTSDDSTGVTKVDGLVWLDPAGPPAEWIAALAQVADAVTDGELLTSFLSRASAFHPRLATLLRGRNPDAVAVGFDDLSAWLIEGDGLVPLVSQLPDGWVHGTTVGSPHGLLPQDPAVISQVVTRLAAATGPVLMIAPPFADRTIFVDMIRAVTGAPPSAGRHFDLRALPDPAEVDLTQVVAVAGVYTADLLPDSAVTEVEQLRRVAQRIRTLTGQAPRVVGHSTSGVVARTLAADDASLVAGLITLGSPHAGSDLLPLVDDMTADAVRAASSVSDAISTSTLGSVVRSLNGLLDGTGGALGGAITPVWFAGAAMDIVDTVPRFAIGSQLDGDLIGLLVGSTISGLAATAPPTHVSFGIRLGLTTPHSDEDGSDPDVPRDIVLSADARLDLARVRLVEGAVEPARPATALSVSTATFRPNGWLVGAGTLPDGQISARVRLIEAGVTVTPGGAPATGTPGADVSAGGLGIKPWLRLVDASVDASLVREAISLGDDGLREALDAVLAELRSAPANPAAQAVLDLLEAAGATIATTEGPRASIQGITDLATVPIRTLTERRAALGAWLRGTLGDPDTTGIDLGGLDAGALSITLPELPLRLSLDDTTMVVRLETVEDITLTEPFQVGGHIDFDTRTLAATLDVSLFAGPTVLRRTTDGTITVSGAPYIASPIVMRPFDGAVLQSRLVELIPDLAVSAVVTAVLGDMASSGISVPPISALVRDPVGWLSSTAALGTATGLLDGDTINDLLRTIAGALGLDDALGLALPGGFLLTASGSDPLHVQLSGAFVEDSDVVSATVRLGLDLRTAGPVPDDVQVTPAGDITIDLTLPGDWGDLSIAFGVAASGVRLVVTPDNVGQIQLLPTVTGLGELLGTAGAALVPKVLQEITDALMPNAPHPVLDIALQIAEALGIYDPAAGGFVGAGQAAQLRSMLDPDWLQAQVTDPALIIGHIQSLFPSGANPGVIPLPAGHRITRVEDRLRWEMDLFAGSVLGAELGWAAAGHPQVLVSLTGFDTGPVTIGEARLGYLDDFEGLVQARLEVGDPMDWFTPEVAFSLVGDRVGLRILPLGDEAADQVAVVLVPVPDLTLTPEGGLRLAGSWLLPLVIRYVIPQLEALLEQVLWSDGPSARDLLAGAGIITSATGPLRIVARFPEPPVMGIGALEAALSGVGVQLTEGLDLQFAEDDGRLGIRLQGAVTIPGDVSVTILFGEQQWIGDDAGITAWVIGPSHTPAMPIAPAPGLDVIGVGLRISGADDDHPLFGGEEDSVVQLGGIGAMFFGNFAFWDPATSQATFAVDSLGAAVEFDNTAIRVNGSDGDSFVAKLIPQELGAGFTIAVAYRNDRLEVHGGPGDLENGIQLTFPLNVNVFDVILLRELYLAAVFGDRTDIVAALSGNAELGPIAVTVDRVGLRVTISGSGAVLSFKAPDGFGFSLDASTIRLGGFLLVDEARGRYVGALEIAVLQKFSLTAIGIITTKRPDGSPGFSLLMLITVTLPVPIPLGYGFFFAGAGGLLGLNRGMDVDRIRDGLRTGTADSILFPTDIINRIDVIVRDLEEAFPAQEGHFLIAPMGMITWMNPALVTLKIGIILEIAPQPNIALLGVLRLALPTPDEAVVDLKVAFIGGIDIGASLLYFNAAIYDSFIGYADFKLSLEGDIAIRLCWGAKPDLVVSIGGFHPSYKPASHLKLPAMRRLTLSLLKGNPRLTLKLYFAVTSNTIQFGAQLAFFVGVDGFSISGDLGFDVLVQFVPFLIEAHMWGRLAVTAGGTDVCSIKLDLQLRGPTPWYAHGTASIGFLFFSISVEVEARLGDAHETSIPAEPVLSKLLDQFRDPLNWTASLAASASVGVTLMPLPSGALVVDAAGLLSAQQNLMPLETDIGLVGKTPPSDVQRVSITGLTFGTTSPQPITFADVTAPFSPSTFAGSTSTNPDLLTAPAFEDRPNGVRASSGESLEADFVLHHPQAFEMIVIDDPDPGAPTPPAVPANPKLMFSKLIAGGAIANSAGSRLQAKLNEGGSVRQAAVTEQLFAVTAKDSLAPVGAAGEPVAETVLLSRTDAEQRLANMPADGRRFQIVPGVQVGL
ncbi:hypothetical protein QNO00_16825 [Arthrobacter sp. zg-Y1219]|uniref:DUF6603 domain-containing protein n=1 Tax=Arthrobacter sp. zg-Y1219 TaxID=3049067 RepID=UPI0024C2DF73|nr:DUF6603 domain-containing protein [Arthrobacter sp. zg-Y1219]MDK1361917.1 hypothetical protein [Arthrobacter sp. zg-Y1219]